MYTCSAKTLQEAAALARRNHAPILIHLAEAPFELQLSRRNMESRRWVIWRAKEFWGPDVTGAHCVWVDQADIATLVQYGVGCTNNPSSNMKTAAGSFAGGGYAGGGGGGGAGDGWRGEQQQPGHV
jgi:5-methylthioadenosine/S-adenosylhomocysteine deaminase